MKNENFGLDSVNIASEGTSTAELLSEKHNKMGNSNFWLAKRIIKDGVRDNFLELRFFAF